MPYAAPQHDDHLLRPSVAAKRLGVCTETIWRWMRKGVLDYEEIGPYRKKRIRESAIESMRNVPRESASDNI